MITPLKFNMEPENGGLVQMIFLFSWVILGSMLNFRGVSCNDLDTFGSSVPACHGFTDFDRTGPFEPSPRVPMAFFIFRRFYFSMARQLDTKMTKSRARDVVCVFVYSVCVFPYGVISNSILVGVVLNQWRCWFDNDTSGNVKSLKEMNGIGMGYWGFHPVVTVVYITISDLSSLITCHTVHREVMTGLSSSKQGEELLSVPLIGEWSYHYAWTLIWASRTKPSLSIFTGWGVDPSDVSNSGTLQY